MYRYYAIFLFTMLLLVAGCGSPLKTSIENKPPELDTSLYNKYIVKEPDTNIYPIYVRASSQRLPTSKFGTSCMLDHNRETWWSSGTGLNAGEYVEMDFASLKASVCKVILSDNPVAAKITSVSVWVNDSLYGNFPSGAPIPLPAVVNKIKIKANETDGINEVKLPLDNDSTSRTQYTKKNIITRYNSRSFGISEVEFYNNKGVLLPVYSIPVKPAVVQCAYITAPGERFNVFDNDPSTSALWFQAGGSGKILFVFNDFTPFTKLRITTVPAEYLGYQLTEEIGFQINGKKEQRFTLKPGLNQINMPEPFVAKTFTLSFYKFYQGAPFGGLSEIQGYDGARWYNIEPDSMYARYEHTKDSLANTPAFPLINNQVAYTDEYVVLNTDTYKVINPSSIPGNLLEKFVTQKSQVLFRENFLWEAKYTSTVILYGKKVSLTEVTRHMFGDYRVVSQSADQVVLNLRCKVNEVTTRDGKPSPIQSKAVTCKAIITPTHLTIEQGLLDMVISY